MRYVCPPLKYGYMHFVGHPPISQKDSAQLLHVQNDCNQTVVGKGSIFVDIYAASRKPCIHVLVIVLCKVCSELQTAYVTKYRDVMVLLECREIAHTRVYASGTSPGFLLLCSNA